MPDLQYGIALPNWEVEGDTERFVEYGVAAEDAGWDGVFLADHLAMDGEDGYPDFPDPWITLSGIATRTDEIRLGSWVTPIPRRQPWQLARDLATFDRLVPTTGTRHCLSFLSSLRLIAGSMLDSKKSPSIRSVRLFWVY